jgi:hypothetical protein
MPDDFYTAGGFKRCIVQQSFEGEGCRRTIGGIVLYGYCYRGFPDIRMEVNCSLCKLGRQFCPIKFGIFPGIHLFYRATARAMDAFYTAVADKPRSVADPAFSAEAFVLSGFPTFWTKKIPNIHSE